MGCTESSPAGAYAPTQQQPQAWQQQQQLLQPAGYVAQPQAPSPPQLLQQQGLQRLSEEISGGERLKQRWGGAKMDAEAVVLKELESGRNSKELANALSLLTSLK